MRIMGRKKILTKVKNYKELCEFFDKKACSSGKDKEKQLLDLERYGDFKKDSKGYGYTIYSKYNTPIPKTSTRGFQTYIQDLLIDMVAKEKGTIRMTMNQLLLALGMVNSNYSNAKKDVPNFSKIMDIPEEEIYDWFYGEHGVSNNLSQKVIYGLDELNKSSWLFYYIKTNLCKFNVIYKEGKPYKEYYFEEATEEDCKYIIGAERDAYEEILDKLNIKEENIRRKVDKQWLYTHHKLNEWKEIVTSILNVKNIEYSIKVYNILGNEKDLEIYKRYDNKILSKQDKALYYSELNNSLVESLQKSFKTKHNTAIKKCGLENAWGDNIIAIDFAKVDNGTKIRAKDEYIENSNAITKKLIDNTTEYDVRLEKNK